MSAFWAGYLLGVSQNLVAAVVLGVPALWRLHKKLDGYHRTVMFHVKRIRATAGGRG